MKNVLLMTCTVKPQTKENVKVGSPRERIVEYVETIDFFSRKLRSCATVVVLENSGCIQDIGSALQNVENVELFQVNQDSLSEGHGKSAGELEMLRTYLHSRENLADSKIWKVTGHLKITNIERLISRHHSCNITNYNFIHSSSSDSRFFGMNGARFRDFVSNEVLFSETSSNFELSELKFKSMEQYLFAFVSNAVQNNQKICMPAELPLYVGRSFSTGKELIQKRAKFGGLEKAILRSVGKKLALGYEIGNEF